MEDTTIIREDAIHIDERALQACSALLRRQGLKLMLAESMTAGYLSSIWAMELNSGSYFLGSQVCYQDETKTSLLGVPPIKIHKYCAESAVVTLRMLDGLMRQLDNDTVAVSITGLAFKTNNSRQWRPIGTVYYAFGHGPEKVLFKRQFDGDAAAIFIAASNMLLQDLHQWLLQRCAVHRLGSAPAAREIRT